MREALPSIARSKKRKVAPHACDLKLNANGPNVLGLEWLFLPDE
jgi:hypothetical protein